MSGATSASIAAYAALAVAAVGSAYASIESGRQQKAMAERQAQSAVNAAAYDADAAKAHAENIRKAGRAQVGEAKAALAASGVKLGEGTALEIQKSIVENSAKDELSAILSGKRATAAANEEAGMLMQAGANAQNNGYMSAATTVLGTGATIYGDWKTKASK